MSSSTPSTCARRNTGARPGRAPGWPTPSRVPPPCTQRVTASTSCGFSQAAAPLQALPHTIGYAGSGSGSREQQTRLLRHLKNELDRRKADPTGDRRRIVFLLDGLATLRDEYQDIDGMALLDSLYRVYADGPELAAWIKAR